MTKALIIDDDLFYRKIFKKKFEVSGFQAEIAENGQKGLDLMHSFKPDIVFVDLLMPLMDGHEFLKRVKADDELKNTPVVVLTNLSTTDANTVLEHGATAVMVKADSDPDAIIAKAKEVLGS